MNRIKKEWKGKVGEEERRRDRGRSKEEENSYNGKEKRRIKERRGSWRSSRRKSGENEKKRGELRWRERRNLRKTKR